LKQKAEASKAVELDDALPAGHLELANAVEMLDWDWVTAESEFKRALELNPNEADAHWAYCFHLERVGRIAEALAETKVALQLDPVSGRSFVYSEFAYYFSRHYGEALAQIARDHEVDPDSWNSYWLGAIYAEKGMYTESVSAFQKQGDQPYALGHRGNALARAGRAVEARAIIPKLEEQMRRNGVGAYEIALVYSGFGEKDQAFAWLEKSYAVHDKGLLYLKIDPCLDPLRSDPRFDNLVRRVGFPA
jgi:tetratricopeptide (TPR) repeat protein